MYSIGVLEEVGGKIAEAMKEWLNRLPERKSGSFLITRSENIKMFHGKYDMIVVTPEMAGREESKPHNLECGILLVPGKYAGRLAEGIRTGCIVSYGMSRKDTITISSINKKATVLAIQRELITLKQNMLERQEISVHGNGKMSSDKIMAIYGSLLLMGMAPEKFE